MEKVKQLFRFLVSLIVITAVAIFFSTLMVTNLSPLIDILQSGVQENYWFCFWPAAFILSGLVIMGTVFVLIEMYLFPKQKTVEKKESERNVQA